ncbi:MAG: hypothetical protein GX058_09800 [Firmicutes bacterium]|nr:hypothetical protein [Bacillota bacterium]
MEIVLTTNSPGEVAGWVRPMVRQLRADWPEARISLFVLPCAFASGRECLVASEIEGIRQVFSPRDYWRLALWGKKPAGFQPGPRGLVLFLGGDQTHAVIIGRRLGYPVFIYTEGRALWPRAVKRYFVPYPQALRRAEEVAPGQVELVGNLMLDAIRTTTDRESYRAKLKVGRDEQLIALFPGSRPAEFRYAISFFQQTIARIAAARTDCRFVLCLSPFIAPELAAELWTATNLQVPMIQGEQYEIMQAADLAITIPGTNNVEMAFFGLPMVVALPLDRPELIPLEGLPGLVGDLPLIGPKIKAYAVKKLAARYKYTALTNVIAQRMVVPEVRGEITPADVAHEVLNLLADPRRRHRMSADLREVVGATGAAQRIVATLKKFTGQEDEL